MTTWLFFNCSESRKGDSLPISLIIDDPAVKVFLPQGSTSVYTQAIKTKCRFHQDIAK